MLEALQYNLDFSSDRDNIYERVLFYIQEVEGILCPVQQNPEIDINNEEIIWL